MRVVVCVPLARGQILAVSIVETATHDTHVVGDSKEIVNRVLLLRISAPVLHIEPLDWEIDQVVDLVPVRTRITETLEVDNENIRQSVQIKFLGGLTELLALATIPGIVLTQHFRLGKGIKSLTEGQRILLV